MIRTLASFALVAAAMADSRKKPLKKYTIDLDLAPEERFVELVKDHKTYIKVMVQALQVMFSGDSAKQLLAAADEGMDNETRAELKGMAAAIDVTWEHVLMAHYFYELSDVTEDLPEEWKNVATRSCTGIVAQNSNGTVMMARNQDYPPPFSPLQYDGTYVKGGKVVYEGTSFAGIVGVGGTCMVPGKYSAEINARGSHKPSFEDAIAAAKRGSPNFPMLLRKGCEQGLSFEDALTYYSETPLILGGYVTVAGAAAGEGAVVTRGADPKDTDLLRLSSGYPSDKPWFLVQTNYDHWEDAPKSDNRRDSAICLMTNLGADNVDLEALWTVVSDEGKGQCNSSRGVYNGATIHTELVIPATGEYHTYLRHNIIDVVV